jgi:putative SOS response-associated peptidase YedK
MCGRYTLTKPAQAFTAGQLGLPALDLTHLPNVTPRFNAAPTDLLPIVRHAEKGEGYQIEVFRWGLIPFYAKDPKEGAKAINARADSVEQKPAFRKSFRERRCLVLADGFFEWQPVGKAKQPWFIRPANGEPFAMAGLWDRWRAHLPNEQGRGEPIYSFTIITTDANPLIAPLHDRMPVILEPKSFALWLDPKVQDPAVLHPLLVPFSPDGWTRYRVDRRVNKVENDDAACIEPRDEAQGSLFKS